MDDGLARYPCGTGWRIHRVLAYIRSTCRCACAGRTLEYPAIARFWHRFVGRDFGNFAVSEEDLAFFLLKKQQIIQKKMLFPYENMIFSSSIRKASEK